MIIHSNQIEGRVMEGEQGLPSSAAVVRSQDVLSTRMGDELVLMSVDQGLYFGLDAIGADIWERLEHPISICNLCAGMVADYQGDPSAIEHDILNLLRSLAGRNLITITF